MDIKAAATAMRPFVKKVDWLARLDFNVIARGGDATSVAHLYEMIEAIESGEVSGEKAHRWLGWMQGVVCCRGGATLEEMKAVNLAA
ncbi:MAG TPA: hypothetical protein VFM18_17125 [Methanosarcina sp.]|nr:hypothetical protein [Methanosarcina sp.]